MVAKSNTTRKLANLAGLRVSLLCGTVAVVAGSAHLIDSWTRQEDALPTRPTIRLDVNIASAAQLEALPSIGPSAAGRIVDWRNHHGPFRQIDDLANVTGVGPATIQKIQPLLFVSRTTRNPGN